MPMAPENLLSGQVLLSKKVYPIVHDGNPRLVHDGKTALTMTFANDKQMIYGTEGERALAGTSDSVEVWLQRYGHLPLPAFKHVSEAPPELRNARLHCTTCQKGKSAKAASKLTGHRASNLLETVHSDLCGPMETKGVNGQRYICTLIDDYSRMTMLRAIPSKADASDAVLEMIDVMETQAGTKVRSIKTDNGGEYRSTEFLQLLRAKGIALKETVPYHSQTNAVAERTNRTLITMARTALLHSNLPKALWPEAEAHAAYTKNRTPIKPSTASLRLRPSSLRSTSSSKGPSSEPSVKPYGCTYLTPPENSPLAAPKAESSATPGVPGFTES